MLASIAMIVMIFFFKQKTTYEMRISDGSSDVCSSDLVPRLIAVEVGEDAVLVLQAHRSILPRSPRAKSRGVARRVSTSLDTNGRGCGIGITIPPGNRGFR